MVFYTPQLEESASIQHILHTILRTNSQSKQVFERLDEQLLTEPQEKEAADEVSHAEETDARCTGDEDDHQRHPVHVHEDASLNVVEIRPAHSTTPA